MKILFLTPYPLGEAPSQRFRFEQYFSLLINVGYHLTTQSFLPTNRWKIFYAKGNFLQKFLLITWGFVKRIEILFRLTQFKFVFIHREMTPIGPPIFEWIIAKVFRKKIIYDFDDAIWLSDKKESRIEKGLRWRTKVSSICRWSYKVSCGNDYLCNYARQFNKNVIHNPTTIDTVNLHNPTLYSGISSSSKKERSVIIGWTGSHSTLKYLNTVESALKKLELAYPLVRFLIIADRKPTLSLQRMDFIAWNKETEAADLMLMDVGIMPLPNDEWAQGKCGFKALQYMALEIPAVASPVGVNTTIVQHGTNGFLCEREDEWFTILEELIHNDSLRKEIGKVGRSKIISAYSVLSNSKNFLSLFD